MTKKIEVWATSFQVDQLETGHQADVQPMKIDKPSSDYKSHNITMVVHENDSERVFTESEVRAMLLKVRGDYHAPEDIEFLDALAQDELGIVLDPA